MPVCTSIFIIHFRLNTEVISVHSVVVKITVKHLTFIWFITLAPLLFDSENVYSKFTVNEDRPKTTRRAGVGLP